MSYDLTARNKNVPNIRIDAFSWTIMLQDTGMGYVLGYGANISPAYIILGADTSNDISAITELLSQLEPKHIDSAVEVLKAFVNAINQK